MKIPRAGTRKWRHVLICPFGPISIEEVEHVAEKIGIEFGEIRGDNVPPIHVLSENTTDLSHVQPSSKETIICISEKQELPKDSLFREFARVLEPGGIIFVHKSLEPNNVDSEIRRLWNKLSREGFIELDIVPHTPQVDFRANIGGQPLPPLTARSFGVVAQKPSVRIGCAFVLKKPANGSVKIQLQDATELTGEECLFTKEDSKKHKVIVGDCEDGSARKACKNSSCEKAEDEEKEKLGLTLDQINNPQSACGNVVLSGNFFEIDTDVQA